MREGGGDFSAGERQLLALARALLPEPPRLLIADECSSNVDEVSDSNVHDVLLGLDATVLAICHRLRHVGRGSTRASSWTAVLWWSAGRRRRCWRIRRRDLADSSRGRLVRRRGNCCSWLYLCSATCVLIFHLARLFRHAPRKFIHGRGCGSAFRLPRCATPSRTPDSSLSQYLRSARPSLSNGACPAPASGCRGAARRRRLASSPNASRGDERPGDDNPNSSSHRVRDSQQAPPSDGRARAPVLGHETRRCRRRYLVIANCRAPSATDSAGDARQRDAGAASDFFSRRRASRETSAATRCDRSSSRPSWRASYPAGRARRRGARTQKSDGLAVAGPRAAFARGTCAHVRQRAALV